MNTIDLYAQVVLRAPELAEPTRDAVVHIRSEVRALVRMILNLLDVSRAEEGSLRPSVGEVDLRAQVSGVFETLALRARGRGVRLEQDLAVATVQADSDLLRRVIENLVDNAIRYAPHDTVVSVSTRREGARTVLRVSDAGKGIPAAQRARVFERFAQAESSTDARTNRGLGLAYCKLVVEAHGGAIRVEDGAPGAVFCVELPDGR